MDKVTKFKLNIVTWNLLFAEHRNRLADEYGPQQKRLGFETRSEQIVQTIQRLSGNRLPTVFCLQELDTRTEDFLKTNMKGWVLYRPPTALQDTEHTTALLFHASQFVACDEEAVVHRPDGKAARWAATARLIAVGTGVTFQLQTAHLYGCMLNKPDPSRANGDTQLKAALTRLKARHLSCDAFEAIGFDSNRLRSDKKVGQLLAQHNFGIAPHDHHPTNFNTDLMKEVELDHVAVAPSRVVEKVTCTWKQVDPGFSLKGWGDVLQQTSDHLPNMTEVEVERTLEQELLAAEEHLRRVASMETPRQAAGQLRFIETRGLTSALRRRHVARCNREGLSQQHLMVGALLGLWSLPKEGKLPSLTQLLLRNKRRFSANIRMIVSLRLPLDDEGREKILKHLAPQCDEALPAPWVTDDVLKLLLEEVRADPSRNWVTVARAVLGQLEVPQQQFNLARELNECAPNEASAEAEIAARSKIGTGVLVDAYALQRLARHLSADTIICCFQRLVAAKLSAKEQLAVIKRIKRYVNVQHPAVYRAYLTTCHALLEEGDSEAAARLFKTYFAGQDDCYHRPLLHKILANCRDHAVKEKLASYVLQKALEKGDSAAAFDIFSIAKQCGLSLAQKKHLALHEKFISLIPVHTPERLHYLLTLQAPGMQKQLRKLWEKQLPSLVRNLCDKYKEG